MSDLTAAQFRLRAERALALQQSLELVDHPTDQAPIKDLAWHEGEVLHLKDAAVLIPIIERAGAATVLLTQRTHH